MSLILWENLQPISTSDFWGIAANDGRIDSWCCFEYFAVLYIFGVSSVIILLCSISSILQQNKLSISVLSFACIM